MGNEVVTEAVGHSTSSDSDRLCHLRKIVLGHHQDTGDTMVHHRDS